MRTTIKAISFIPLISSLICFCSRDVRADSQIVASPNAKTIAIVLTDRHWTIEELDKLAREHVWGQKGPSIEEVRQTAVTIRPRDPKIMCEFTYSAGFAKPFWVVQIGYDGKVKQVKKGIKREG